MRIGIRRIEWIDAAMLHDYSAVAPGSSVSLASFVKEGGSLTELPFVPEVASFIEEWLLGDEGLYSEVTFEASIRKDKELYRPVLLRLQGKKAVWKVTAIDGREWIIGSPEYVPTFTWSESESGISSSGFDFTISNQSLHGALRNASEG